ncbi:MAG: heparinase II/III family protein [Gemmatimonadaceae bacterium]|nr:heparinase II/III family protein [Gemmatimonadaceae bacterium]
MDTLPVTGTFLLASPADLAARREVVAGPLAGLARSLEEDLSPLLAADRIVLPPEKARLTRTGGRCPVHGVLLAFDPLSPRAHTCPVCGDVFTSDDHYRWWIMNYQLWLAERCVHAAALAATRESAPCRDLAERILSACVSAYLHYPNKDNVLGPTRPFFSTYLESIWALQLAVALDLLEQSGATGALGAAVRSELLEPSLALICEYDEGASNRQVWNNAAMLAIATLLANDAVAERAIHGKAGLLAHLRDGLLADGAWYEGENYHQFAHRGLWYGVTMAERRGEPLPEALAERFAEAFAIPFATALPDFTSPARRDSQYGVSLRQWRYAESCELGLARRDDPRLSAALLELYRDDVAPGDTERARSTAEAERNAPAARLTRASLGWKSLLHAQPTLPDAPRARPTPASVHLAHQGFAVFRRRGGQVYAGLDYGVPGGGHGHPDRLNLWLVTGADRWLEDVGTGSYVDRSLFWYRSTLAHNAPLMNGTSQPYGAGVLRAWDEQGDAGWVEAEFEIVPGRARVTRRLIVMPGYLIDEVRWASADDTTFDLPMHVDPDEGPGTGWEPSTIAVTPGSGFEFLRGVERASGTSFDAFAATRAASSIRGWIQSDAACEWYRATAPGPPGEPPRRFIFSRWRGHEGRMRMVCAWDASVSAVRFTPETISLLAGGERHAHRAIGPAWHVRTQGVGAPVEIVLRGRASAPRPVSPAALEAVGTLPRHMLAAGRPFVMELAERHYRRSELPWAAAGAPEASLRVAAGREAVDIDVQVRKRDPVFAPPRRENLLDNEDPDINSDGLQLYLTLPDSQAQASWLLVPEEGGGVRIAARQVSGSVPAIGAEWRLTTDGYRVRIHLPRGSQGLGIDRHFMLNVVINEISRDRERRRGQLVATGATGEWVYLRGDREDPLRMLAFEIVDA